MLTHRIPAYFLPVALLLGIVATVLLLRNTTVLDSVKLQAREELAKPTAIVCTYNLVRRNGLKRVKPLISADQACEAVRYRNLKLDLDQLVTDLRGTGVLQSASIYLRDTKRGEWMSYNDAETYDPGSLLKVPTLMTWLDMAQDDPDVLERRYTLAPGMPTGSRAPEFMGASIEPGRPYSVAELLAYMVVHSDNRATGLLNRNVDLKRMLNVFTDLGLPAPSPESPSHLMTCREVSVFMNALYDASFLKPAYSEMALEMLSHSDFDQGLRAGIPADIEIAHKFGESGNAGHKQLHETALVYFNDEPYILTVMTKGRDLTELTTVLESIARKVHDHLKGARPAGQRP